MTKRDHEWTWDELILLLDLYYRFDARSLSSRHPEVKALSNLLKTSNLPGGAITDKFRNAVGITMKIANLMHLDPDYPGEGLPAHSKRDVEIWKEFSNKREECLALAAAIRARLAQTPIPEEPNDIAIGSGFEGSVLMKVHRRLERNAGIVAAKKAEALERDGDLLCEACDFSFSNTYGSSARGFIECHHNRPLSELAVRTRTRLDDLALVCANCHRMLHHGLRLLTVPQLREMIVTQLGCGRAPL
jgi:5-methylcytosine-specific restriction protein A